MNGRSCTNGLNLFNLKVSNWLGYYKMIRKSWAWELPKDLNIPQFSIRARPACVLRLGWWRRRRRGSRRSRRSSGGRPRSPPSSRSWAGRNAPTYAKCRDNDATLSCTHPIFQIKLHLLINHVTKENLKQSSFYVIKVFPHQLLRHLVTYCWNDYLYKNLSTVMGPLQALAQLKVQ